MKSTIIKFRYLRNVTLSLGDGQFHAIPVRTVPVKTALRDSDMQRVSQTGETYRTALTSHFDMNKIFEVELLDETPHLPEKSGTMSQAYWEKLRDQALDAALENRKKNDVVRTRLGGYAKSSISFIGEREIVIPPTIEICGEVTERETDIKSDWDDVLQGKTHV